jgi:choline dehydrogenase-like flavoprotein
MDDYDVIIVGSGAGGGTLARHLAPSGKRILLLERGDWLPREPANWLAQDVFVENKYISPDTWYDGDGKAFQPQVHYFVGGATKLYGAALYRLRPGDFGELRHHDGISPAWPISYDDLEPYYSLAEQLYEVHGARGEDPTEGPASAPYPFPAVSHEPRIQQLHDDLEAAGYQPFHAPCGVRLNEANMPYSACVRCANCDGFVCAVHGKSDAEVLGVRPALEHPNVTLVTNAHVTRLGTNGGGRTVTEVLFEHGASTESVTADIVVLACGAANTAKLLLLSHNEKHPDGLANGSDQVGRNYMFHNSAAVLALSKDENPTVFQKTLGLNDFYFGSKEHDYPLGNMQMVGKSQAPMFRGEKPTETKLAPQWSLERIAKHAIDFWLSTEDLPRPENRVSVDRDGKVTLAYTPTNEVPKRQLYDQLRSMLGKLHMEEDHLFHRFAYMKTDIPVAGVAHQAGTCRFGSDPASSVLNEDCRAHELDNLYVVDTSVFPSIGAVNPALTAMANSLRVGDHLLERLEASVTTAVGGGRTAS